MTDLSKLCMVCFSEKDENNVCPVCGGDAHIRQESPLLPLKSIVAQRYYVGKAYKQNSEGITYGAYDIVHERTCTIREFFPDALVSRDFDGINTIVNRGSEEDFASCKGSFIELWNKLFRLKGLSALITVSEVFSSNGTMYAVYEESERYTLRDYLLETGEGYISWEKARVLMMPVLSTLGTLHTSGIIHRGLNPESFIFSKDGKIKVTDFCIEQARTITGDISAELFDGYSPLELYSPTGQKGTWTDIYAFTAVLYRVLVGSTPIDAKTRAQNDRMMIPAKFAEQLPPYVINAIINGMQLAPGDRTRNVEQLRSNLSASPRAVNASASVYTAPYQNQAPQRPVNAPTKAVASPVRSSSSVPSQPSRQPVTERVSGNELVRENEKKKSKKKTAVIVILILVILGLGATIGILAKNISGDNKKDPDETTIASSEMIGVPSFLGFSAEQVMKNADYADSFEFKTVEENSLTVAEGIVIGQDIAANTMVAKGTVITLTVSSGKKTITLIDFSGYTFEQAEATLNESGIRVVKSYKFNDGTNPSNVVVETIPPANSVVSEGDTVQVVIWQDVDNTTEEDSEANTDSGNESQTQSSDSGNAVQQFFDNIDTFF